MTWKSWDRQKVPTGLSVPLEHAVILWSVMGSFFSFK